jgi:formylglycine-generating enzyme required for sulfatase activity
MQAFMIQSYSTVLYCVVKYVALLAIIVVAFQSSDVPGEGNKFPRKYTETITSKSGQDVSFEMVLVPGGMFVMGSPEDEVGHKDDEGPQHKVHLDTFYLCTTETTLELFLVYYQETVSAKKDYVAAQQAEKNTEQAGRDDFDAITGPTPVYGDLTMGYEENHPAIGMTWHNAMTFCMWLSKKTGKQYRLPTEAEWEYACRAATTSIFGFGNDPNQLVHYAWYKANSEVEAHEVAQKRLSFWGLYDMSGNVREWVYDFYSSTAYRDTAEKSPAVNPKGPKTGKVHVTRGGDYSSSIEELRCAARAFEEKWWRSGDPQIPKSKWWLPAMDFIGFRVARSVDTGAQKSDR